MYSNILRQEFKRVAEVIAWSAGVVSVMYAILIPILNSYTAERYLLLVTYAVILLTVIFIGMNLIGNRKQEIPKTEVFTGLGGFDEGKPWPRRKEKRKLIEKIKDSDNLLYVVGRSGTGKSVLVNEILKKRMEEEGFTYITLDSYESISKDLSLKLEGNGISLESIGEDKEELKDRVIIVLDQYEDVIEINKSGNDEIKRETEAILELLGSSDNIKVLVVIRDDKYFHLNNFEQKVPGPKEAVHIKGIRGHETEYLKDKYEEAMRDRESAEYITCLLSCDKDAEGIKPVEAKMVGIVLEDMRNERGDWNIGDIKKMFSGINDILKKYFQKYTLASPEPHLTRKILFALSISAPQRISFCFEELVNITHGLEKNINECIDYLRKVSLVKIKNSERYVLTHDFVAEKFYYLSGNEMGPVERDNILHFGNSVQQESHSSDVFSDFDEFSHRIYFSFACLLIAVAILLTRLFFPNLFTVGYRSNLFLDRLDTEYLPIFISHFAWAFYVSLFFSNFLSRIKEKSGGKYFSYSIPILGIGCVILSAMFPSTWIFSIGIIGILVSLKFYLFSRKKHISGVASDTFLTSAKRTAKNSFFVSISGIIWVLLYTNFYSESFALSFHIANTYIMVVMVMFFQKSYSVHCSTSASHNMISMYDRR